MIIDLYASVTSSGGPIGGSGTIEAKFQNSVTPNDALNAVASITAPGLVGVSWTATYNQNTAASAPSGPVAGSGLFSNQVLNIPSGAEVTVHQIVGIPASTPVGPRPVTAFILPSQTDTLVTPAHNEDAQAFNVWHRTISISLDKQLVGAVQPGMPATFSITVRNVDSIDLPIGAVLEDVFPEGFALIGWQASYSGGTGGPGAGGALPVVMSPIPAGGAVTYMVYAKASHCLDVGLKTNNARLTLPPGYTTPNYSKCIDKPLDFIVDPVTPSPCRKFTGGIGSARCESGITYSGKVTISLRSKTGKVWVPYLPSCTTGYGRYIPTGVYESVDVGADGCWVSNFSYIPNGDMIDGSCAAEDGMYPSTSWVITESINASIPQRSGPALTVSHNMTYEVRLEKGVTYAPAIDVAKLVMAN